MTYMIYQHLRKSETKYYICITIQFQIKASKRSNKTDNDAYTIWFTEVQKLSYQC